MRIAACQHDREPLAAKIAEKARFAGMSILLSVVFWATPLTAPAQAVDPARQQVADLLDELESGLESFQAGDVVRYQALTALLARSREAMNGLAGEPDLDVRNLSDRWDNARARLVTAAEHWSDAEPAGAPSYNHPALALQRDAGLLLHDMQNVPTGALSSPDIHAHFTNRVHILSKRLVELGHDAHVAHAREAVAKLDQFLANNGPGHADDDLFLKYMPGNRLVFRAGAGPEEAADWFAAMKALTSTALAEDSKTLAQDIAAGRRDRSDAGEFKRSVLDKWVPEIVLEITTALATLDARVAEAVAFADEVLAVDTTSQREVLGLVAPPLYKQNMDRLQEGVAALAVAQAADEAMGRQQGPNREQQQARLQEAKNAFTLLRYPGDREKR